MADAHDIYFGNSFNVGTAGGDWTVWRICDDEGRREQLILTEDAMDELAAYFAECYAEDRDVANGNLRGRAAGG